MDVTLASDHDYFLPRMRSGCTLTGVAVSHYDDLGIGDPPEPEYPEPTLEEYCEGYGHQLEDMPDGGYVECHCGTVRVPVEGEPHDEYSAACADLIDAYHGILIGEVRRDILSKRREVYGDECSGLRYQLGRELRYKSPSYLKALIDSANASLGEVGDSGPWNEMTLDRYVLLGVHLRSAYMIRLGNTLYWLDEAKNESGGYLAFETLANRHLDGVRALAKLLTLLTGKGIGPSLSEVMSVLLPLLSKKPELVTAAAAILNAQGVSEETAERAVALFSEGVSTHPSVAEGLL